MSDYDSKIIRKQIRVYGSVQGVGFRYRTEHAAESVGATGWVRMTLTARYLWKYRVQRSR